MFIVELTPELLGLENRVGDYAKLTQAISVRAIVWNDQQQIAVAHAKGKYYIPWGASDGEPLLQAIQREIKEEVGVNMKDIEYVGMIREYRMYTEDGFLIENHIFSAKVDGEIGELHLSEEELAEGHEIHWYSISEAKDLFAKALLEAEDPHAITVLQRSLRTLEEYTDMLEKQSLSGWTSAQWDDVKVKELEEIAKKAQYDYVMLKSEFDAFIKRVQSDENEAKLQQFSDLLEKILPIVDQLGQTIDHIPEDLRGNKRVDGVALMYESALNTLQQLSVTRIKTVGETPDVELHDPLGVEPTNDEAMKGKIIKEYSPGYIYEKGDVKKVIKAAKVIVGQ